MSNDGAKGELPGGADRHRDGAAIEDTIIRLVEPTSHTGERPVSAAVDEVLRRLPASARRVPRASAAVEEGDEDAAGGIAEPPARIDWMLVVRSSATTVPLDRPVLVGRAPALPRVAGSVEPRRLVVPNDRRGVSSTHARIEQLGDSLVVTDAGSTNGLVVHWASGPPRRLRPGESCVVLPDAAIDLGDGIVLEFHPHPSPPKEQP